MYNSLTNNLENKSPYYRIQMAYALILIFCSILLYIFIPDSMMYGQNHLLITIVNFTTSINYCYCMGLFIYYIWQIHNIQNVEKNILALINCK